MTEVVSLPALRAGTEPGGRWAMPHTNYPGGVRVVPRCWCGSHRSDSSGAGHRNRGTTPPGAAGRWLNSGPFFATGGAQSAKLAGAVLLCVMCR
jgi:hypothetical protein